MSFGPPLQCLRKLRRQHGAWPPQFQNQQYRTTCHFGEIDSVLGHYDALLKCCELDQDFIGQIVSTPLEGRKGIVSRSYQDLNGLGRKH